MPAAGWLTFSHPIHGFQVASVHSIALVCPMPLLDARDDPTGKSFESSTRRGTAAVIEHMFAHTGGLRKRWRARCHDLNRIEVPALKVPAR